jgi:hypothetical protein
MDLDLSKLPSSSKDLKAKMVIGYLFLLKKMPLRKTGSPMTRQRWKCSCTAPGCGKQVIVPQNYLVRRPDPKYHCGCVNIPQTLQYKYKREYGIWTMMHVRTEDPRHEAYKHYGGRGIKVCQRWHKSNPQGFHNFIADMGPAPTSKHQCDRWPDNDAGYQPGNTRWATPKENANNRRTNLNYVHNKHPKP